MTFALDATYSSGANLSAEQKTRMRAVNEELSNLGVKFGDLLLKATKVDGIYDAFLDKVSESRHMKRDAVHEIAQGRVWSGRKALSLGLLPSSNPIPSSSMIITTTALIEGRPVQQYLGIVTGEVISGANIVRDIFASVTDIFGGRSGKYEEVLSRAREQALEVRAIPGTYLTEL